MGNTSPTFRPLPKTHEGYVGNSYTTTKTIYLQKSLLGGNNLVLEADDPEPLNGDKKFSVRQYRVPIGSRIDITHIAAPRDGIGFGFFGSVTPQLRGTIYMMGKSLANVNVSYVVGSVLNPTS